MFKNEKKGRLYGIKKDITFVENPPLEDNTTKITHSINFSKNNFLNLGKWILIIVLFLYFGSYTINGFIASNITKDSTEETIVYEYKKQVGSELVGGNFDFIQNYDSLSLLYNKKIYLKYHSSNQGVIQLNVDDFYGGGSSNGLLNLNGSGNVTFYDSNDNIVKRVTRYYSFSSIEFGRTNFYSSNGMDWSSHFLYFTYNENFELNRSDYFNSFIYDFDNDIYTLDKDFSYFIINNLTFTDIFQYGFPFLAIKSFLNAFFIYDYFEEIPIYETTTYTYDIKDINYNWDYKLKQISKFRPLFKNDNIYFKNEEYSNLINLNTFIIPTMSSNEYKQKMIEEKILIDEKVIRARDLGVIDSYSFSSYRETSWFNDNDNSFFYFTLNDISSSGNYELTELVYYLNSNYVTNYTKDNYKKLLESDNFGFDDLIIFPIRLVGNLVYNFGVLIGIITLW